MAVLLLMADPVDTARALGLSLFHADVVAGPTGAALRRVLGGAGNMGPHGGSCCVDPDTAYARGAPIRS